MKILEIKRLSSEQILSTFNVGLMKCGRVKWQEAEVTRKDFKNVLIHQDKKFFISELMNVIQDEIPLILVARQCINSEQFLRAHLSHRMCNQFIKQSNAIILYDTFPAHCTFFCWKLEKS